MNSLWRVYVSCLSVLEDFRDLSVGGSGAVRLNGCDPSYPAGWMFTAQMCYNICLFLNSPGLTWPDLLECIFPQRAYRYTWSFFLSSYLYYTLESQMVKTIIKGKQQVDWYLWNNTHELKTWATVSLRCCCCCCCWTFAVVMKSNSYTMLAKPLLRVYQKGAQMQDTQKQDGKSTKS